MALLGLRSWFFIAWEGSYFNSDQAIVGLMAKHLAERRAWPLFFYGQEYMLGVEAWVAAPIFAILGVSVATLRTALILLNLITGLLLLRLLVKDAGLSVRAAAVASSPFWIAPIVTSANLVEAMGGNIEPLLWVLVLWVLRRQRVWLGVCLGIGFLNREFTIYAVPALAIVQIVERRRGRRALVTGWLITASSFVLMLQFVDLLKPYADLYGPSSAGLPFPVGGRSVAALLVDRVTWQSPTQLGLMVTDYLPTLIGLAGINPFTVGLQTPVHVGWPGLLWVAGGSVATTLIWLMADPRRHGRREGRVWAFPAYLISIGIVAGVAYAVSKPLNPATVRYGLLLLYVPIGVSALALHRSRALGLRSVAAGTLVLLATASAVDHVRVLTTARTSPPGNGLREIADRLQAEGITVARGEYWRAYAVTFLTGEAVKIAATDFERVAEYSRLADEADRNGTPAALLTRTPCAGGIAVSDVYICRSR
jgi:hypothetical protein